MTFYHEAVARMQAGYTPKPASRHYVHAGMKARRGIPSHVVSRRGVVSVAPLQDIPQEHWYSSDANALSKTVSLLHKQSAEIRKQELARQPARQERYPGIERDMAVAAAREQERREIGGVAYQSVAANFAKVEGKATIGSPASRQAVITRRKSVPKLCDCCTREAVIILRADNGKLSNYCRYHDPERDSREW